MSKTIDVDVNDLDELKSLSDDDLRYLLERQLIPEEFRQEFAYLLEHLATETIPMKDRGNTGTVRSMSTDELEKELERRRAEDEENPNRAEDDNPSFDDEEEYSKMDQKQLKAELRKRGLSTEGKRKSEWIARLERDDSDTLEDADRVQE